MDNFMGKDFLLRSETARTLFHQYAAPCPIIDYHNHLSPRDIAEHRKFRDPAQLWLEGDHYKWRAMRACGVEERLITGASSGYEKFLAWASVVPRLAGCPLYHWTHLELQRYFGIFQPLTPDSAPAIWTTACQVLAEHDTVQLLTAQNVIALCTTDDPADTLMWHQQIHADSTIPFQVLPTFRPDRYLDTNRSDTAKNWVRLGLATGIDITDIASLEHALCHALDRFQSHGCKAADHGLPSLRLPKDKTQTRLLCFLAKEYRRRGMVMQLHFGPLRDQSPRLLSAVGHDAGGDSVGSVSDPAALGCLLSHLEASDALPRTVLYNLNPAENTAFSTMAANFAPQVRYGAAWWFNDHLRGIRAQLDELMETGQLPYSIGMLTDSRSFASFPRHEYFRRILCDKLGHLVQTGQYPEDIPALGRIVEDVCWKNAAVFFALL